ncbi:MAG TPA: NADH-quinone oxidoreductase subunit J [Bryobacterales bacterium]|nr:NADH-quinone oxidoreductase subunit J [Bryobacterales bacterium]
MLDTLLFYIFAALALGGGILTITRKNVVHSAIWLITSLLGVAGLYLLQRAEFLAGVQVILYVGGIMVLFLFVIMLVNLDLAAKQRQFSRHWRVALIASAAAGLEIGYFIFRGKTAFRIAELGGPAPAVTGMGNTELLADGLFSQYLLPFELVSVLLLVAVVGSVIMAKKRI